MISTLRMIVLIINYCLFFALKQSDTLQTLAYAYNARSPETAIGTSLDSVVKLNGIKRKGAGRSTCRVTITGTPFTQISAGAVRDRAGLIWDLPAVVVIGAQGTTDTVVTCRKNGSSISVSWRY